MLTVSLPKAVSTVVAAAPNDVNENLIAILALGALALVILAVVFNRRPSDGATFARIFGFVFIASLGVGLGFSGLSGTSLTTAFTLLGAIAGYLAGAQTRTSKKTGGSSNPAGGQLVRFSSTKPLAEAKTIQLDDEAVTLTPTDDSSTFRTFL